MTPIGGPRCCWGYRLLKNEQPAMRMHIVHCGASLQADLGPIPPIEPAGRCIGEMGGGSRASAPMIIDGRGTL